MGSNNSKTKINYEDVQFIIKNPEGHLLINTLSGSEQHCLIVNTININNCFAFRKLYIEIIC